MEISGSWVGQDHHHYNERVWVTTVQISAHPHTLRKSFAFECAHACGMLACMSAHMCVGTPICVNAHSGICGSPRWASGVSFGCSPSYNWGRVFPLKLEFADPHRLASQPLKCPCTYVGLERQTPPLHLCSKHFNHWAISLALALPWFYITSFLPNSLSFITRLWPHFLIEQP